MITDVRAAEQANRLLYPEDNRINLRIKYRRERWLQLLQLKRADLDERQRRQRRLLDKTVDAYIIFLANMAARYGSNWEKFNWQAFDQLHKLIPHKGTRRGVDGQCEVLKRVYLPYHQAEHPTWMVERLQEVYQHFEFSLVRSCVLSLSVGPHDLEQLAPGLQADGIGRNEWQSAEEAREIMIGAGFDPADEHDHDLIERVMLNIYGTTFSFDPKAGYLGALAPHLVKRVRAKYAGRESDPHLEAEIEDLLLTADVDTATVADFLEYGLTATHLCREMVQCRPGIECVPPVPALRFLTSAQERFWELQQFNSRAAKELFEPRKRQNRPYFEELIGYMRESFREVDGVVLDRQGRAVESGQVILDAFAERTKELAARIDGP